VKGVVILNPEELEDGTGDSVVKYYVEDGAECHKVRCLRDLAEAILEVTRGC